jgi:hypothetical protein
VVSVTDPYGRILDFLEIEIYHNHKLNTEFIGSLN